MDLYSSPMACSLASRIAAAEAGIAVNIIYVDPKTKRTADGQDYLAIAPGGYVPALRLPSGEILNENASVLQWLADQNPAAGLAPAWGTAERYRLIDTLHFLSTELHMKIFTPLFASASFETREEARSRLVPALRLVSARLGERAHLVGDTFTVADAFLVVILNWFRHAGVDLGAWPQLQQYYRTQMARPAVAAAVAEEFAAWSKRAA